MANLQRQIRQGQSVLEYAILLAIVSAAFITMTVYVKRAIQGQLYQLEEKTSAKMKSPPAPTPPVIVI